MIGDAHEGFLEWPIPQGELDSPAVQNRNHFARRFQDRPIQEAIDVYTKMTLPQARQLIGAAERHFLGHPFAGRGIELGAGTALLSCALAERADVERIIALEYVPDVVKLIQPRVIEACLPPADRPKVTRALGSFDQIGLEDESLDFVIELGCLHHSNNLDETMRESYRVLKPGGFLLGFDRVQPDSMTDDEVDDLLDTVYGRPFLERFGYPLDQRLTRRQNGEHEYRRREWRAAFEAAGFGKILFGELSRRAEPPLSSLLRLVGFGEAPAKRGSPRYELRLWLSQQLRRPATAPLRSSVFLLHK
ncbi:MAG: class I SAM-dependent methyltransferase [Acidobacteriota bacterium]